MKSSKPDTSKQDALLAKQKADLERQREQAEQEAEALRESRISAQKRLRGRLSGRKSLIKTSELGVTERLG
jgi:FtsZ-binding cell division protein ZapB